ncbi:hypothetical protein DCC62_04230 [candidate division KSB1 bacterium]|nr:MAG: hypothetical protein DCC62_04230 [candidate division KSB1 bacterium]
MTVEQVRSQISGLSPEAIQQLVKELLAVDRYRRGEIDLSGVALAANLSSLAEAPSLLRQYGIEPKPDQLRTLEGMLASLQSGALDFVLKEADQYTEADLVERYS